MKYLLLICADPSIEVIAEEGGAEWSPECTGATWLDDGDGPAVGRRFEGRNSCGRT
ncbi:hypothetical protein AB0L53_48390 [Nonomuraea sp. NPDC052129]|uniref:hypothetical protein n=1 Tax=Nonomuraea sp. NPDC052129 TaxID=3154651 RepID=UPI00343A1BD0